MDSLRYNLLYSLTYFLIGCCNRKGSMPVHTYSLGARRDDDVHVHKSTHGHARDDDVLSYFFILVYRYSDVFPCLVGSFSQYFSLILL